MTRWLGEVLSKRLLHGRQRPIEESLPGALFRSTRWGVTPSTADDTRCQSEPVPRPPSPVAGRLSG